MGNARDDFRAMVAGIHHMADFTAIRPDPYDASRAPISTLPTAYYQYIPISNARSIRLIELQPGEGRDPIICHLRESLLEACVNGYDALSYVWGSTSKGLVGIQVDNFRLDITPRLHLALDYIRRPDRPQLLWVDAICINQSDIPERNQQVPMMCEIYRDAARTICFLGAERVATTAMATVLEDLRREARSLKPDPDVRDWTVPQFTNNIHVHTMKTELSKKYLGDGTIATLLCCPWWYRAWTVQELLVSSNAVIICGRHSMKWEDLCVAVDHGLNIDIWTPVLYGFLTSAVGLPYLSMRALKGQLQASSSAALHLLHLLAQCRHRNSQDPRDKVYSVIGHLRHTYPNVMNPKHPDGLDIEVNYNHPVSYVYRKTSQTLIQKLQNLDVLGICPKSTMDGLPSWATDWSLGSHISSPLMQDSLDRPRKTHAANSTQADAQFLDDGASMVIRGYEIASVASVAAAMPGFAMIGPPMYGDEERYLTTIPALPTSGGRTGDMSGGGDTHSKTRYQSRTIAHGWASLAGTVIGVQKELFMENLKANGFKAAARGVMGAFKVITNFQAQGNLKRGLAFAWDVTFGKVPAVLGTLFAWEQFAAAKHATNPGVESEHVFWQTLCAGTYKTSVQDTAVLFADWSRRLQPFRKFLAKHPGVSERHPGGTIAMYMKSMWSGYGEFWPFVTCAQHRRLGWAASGWLCLLPEETEVGDSVILAKGGRVPLVVRRKLDGSYMFVGEAYVEGVMGGEAWSEEKCQDMRIS